MTSNIPEKTNEHAGAGDGESQPKGSNINPPVFFGSAALILGAVFLGSVFTEEAQIVLPAVLTGISRNFGWFYVLSVAVFLVFAIYLAASRMGSIRLGPDDSRPDYSAVSWFAMLFSAGMGIGLLFFGVAEPITHYATPPTGEGGTPAAAREAMVTTFFHWGIHAWAIYIVMGLSLAYFSFRRGLPLTVRSALYPLLGDRIYGPIGHLVDITAVLGTMFGVATSLGIGVMQVNAGLSFLLDVPVNVFVQVLLIAAITGAATLSVVSGLDSGVKRLSELNIVFAALLMLFVLIAGPTGFLFNAFAQNIGGYLASVTDQTFRLYAYEPNSWINDWTLFYWGWWISWSPFVGMFIARISRGRTIREFILGVMFVPTGVTFVWLTVFGNTALFAQLNGVVDLADIINAQGNLPVALFAMLETLPWSTISASIAVILVITFFVTSSDSGSLVIDMITSGGNPEPPVWQRVFWAVTEGAVAAVLLVVGGRAGLDALRAASIATALPFTLVLLFICWGLYRGLRSETALAVPRRAGSAADVVTASGPGVPWQSRLRGIIQHYRKEEAERFLVQTAAPALEKVAEQLRASGLDALVARNDEGLSLTVPHGTEEADFVYGVGLRGYRPLSFAFPELPRDDVSGRRHYRAEVEINGIPRNYDIMGYSAEQVIADVLAHYDSHMQLLHAQTRRTVGSA